MIKLSESKSKKFSLSNEYLPLIRILLRLGWIEVFISVSLTVTNSLLKLGKKQVHQANFDVIYDPTNNNNTEISYLKNFGNFNSSNKTVIFSFQINI